MMMYVKCLILLILQACQIETINWPGGEYGLLKPTTGCPSGFHSNGFVFQDTVDTNPSNDRSKVLHIDGHINFCFPGKDSTGSSDTSAHWPEGQYCIHSQKVSTLVRMTPGSIRMYDEENYNKNTKKFTHGLVIIKYASIIQWWKYKYTEFYFSCQTSGDIKIPIELPITKPFYLLPYGSRDCQQVKWMVVTTEWIKYHTRNYIDKSGQKSGTVPYHELGDISNKGITMFYCYYQSCWYNLKNKQGVFQSPRFPGKYPDGQLCSWRIMVPANHTVHVHFKNFSLNGSYVNDYLRFFIKFNGTYRLNETFYGVRQPFSVTAYTEIKFLFRSDRRNNGYGFRAEYHVLATRDVAAQNTSSTTKTTFARTISTEKMIQPTSDVPTSGIAKKSYERKPIGLTRIVAIVIPLTFIGIGIVLFIVILYRCKSKEPKCVTNNVREPIFPNQPTGRATANTQMNRSDEYQPLSRDTPVYESPDNVKEAMAGTTYPNLDDKYPEYHELEPICNGDPDNDGQMYQTLSRDQPEYESPDYSRQNDPADSNMEPGGPEYHELEPVDHCVPDVVYDVLEGPGPDNGPSGDQVYQALDTETTHNPLYQISNADSMVTRNPLYISSD